jgi:hypothetical protein
MKKRICRIAAIALLSTASVFAQGRGGGADWATAQMDAQRTASIRTDANISVATMQKPGFELQWKVKLDNQARQNESLMQGVTVSGVTLFTPLSLVAGTSNNMFAIDNDTGNLLWKRHFDAALPAAGTAACPGGITAGATRVAALTPPAGGGARGRGRGAGYQSAVGQPGEGVPGQLAVRGGGPGAAAPGAPGAAPGAADPNAAGGRGRGARGAGAAPAAPGSPPAGAPAAAPGAPGAPAGPGGPGGGRGGGGPIHVVASDGLLRSLGPASGKDLSKPVAFLPAGARTADLTAVDNVVYGTTSNGCGGVADGIYAVDLASEAKTVVSWKPNGGSPVGSVAFSGDGTLYVAVGSGQAASNGYANAIVALEPKTLRVKDWFTQPNADFGTGPVVVGVKGNEFVAAATKDGRVYLLDPASLGGANHASPLYMSRAWSKAGSAPALTSWEEQIPNPAAAAASGGGAAAAGAPAAGPPQGFGAPAVPQGPPATLPGTRFLLLTIAAPPADAGVPSTNGAITNGALVALKVVDAGGKPALEPAWTSRDLTSPSAAVSVNGVVFVLARGSRSTPATLYSYDGLTGRELWNSGRAMASFVPSRGLWASNGQIYVATFDGTVHAFGFAMDRK